MRKIVIAVLLSLFGPGLGQLYNKEFKKGIWLLVISTVLFVLPLAYLTVKIGPMVPDNPAAINPEKIQAVMMDTISKNRDLFNVVSFLFLGVWAYSISQAYFKAKEEYDNEPKDDEPEDPGVF